MRYKQSFAAFAFMALVFPTSSALAAVDTNEPGTVQLQVEKTWKTPDTPLDIVYSLDGKKVFILTNQSQVLVYKSTGDLLGKIDVGSGVTDIDIAPRGEKLYLIDSKENSFTSLSVNFVVSVATTGSPFLGKENAPITVAVFTDFE